MQNRRRFLRNASLLFGATTGTLASGALESNRLPTLNAQRGIPLAQAVDSVDEARVSRIAFGSCLHQDKPQRIWNAILGAQPDLFLFLGYNIYGDTRDITELRAQYAKLAAQPGFQRIMRSTRTLAIWDDHDYGENDAGASYPLKELSRQTFLEFWREPPASHRWSRNGVYTSRLYGPPNQRIQIIMPDLRYNRTPLTLLDLGRMRYEEWEESKRTAGAPVPGPYARCAERAATMLGEAQWQWLAEQLEVPAQVRIIASSLQVLADFPGWEAWINYACDHQRLIDLIRRKNASGVVFISGDTHYAELSRFDINAPYPLWDLTSSGLTEVWDSEVPNANRVGAMLREENFGVIEIDWFERDPTIRLEARDRFGVTRIAQSLQLSELSVAANESNFAYL